jgi:hypothetical protein
MSRMREARRSVWKRSKLIVFSSVPTNLTGRPVNGLYEEGAAAGVAVELGQDMLLSPAIWPRENAKNAKKTHVDGLVFALLEFSCG